MNKLYTALLFLGLSCLSQIEANAGQKLRVFFIGNSYTYTNNLPKMIADIATSMGDTLIYEDHTPGGYKWQDHWAPPQDPCVGKIKTANWDYVVLQEQSQLPAFSTLGPSHPTYIYAQQFTKLIRDSAVCTTPMFYMTWGYKNGDAPNCPSMPYMCNYLSMDSVIRMRYLELTDSFNAVVSPVGAVRRYIRQHHPGIELYTADGSHPEVAGTYAAACCFYTALFKKDPTQITFNSTIPATNAVDIRAAAKKVVYDSLTKWGLGVYDLAAAYDHSVSGNKVTFTNKSSIKALTYSWNFGDGNTSTTKNPVHTYATAGNYTVTMTAYDANNCGRVTTKKINLLANGIDDMEQAAFAIMPNPATDHLTIQTNRQVTRFNIRIANAMGQVVYLAPANGGEKNTIDLSAFSNGMYYITLYNEADVLHYGKFVKQ